MAHFAWLLVIVFFGFLAGYDIAHYNRFAGFALFVVPVVAYLAWTFRRQRRGANEHNRAISLLSEGRYTDSIAAFEAAAKLMPRNPLPQYGMASTKLWLWKLDEARVGLDESSR